MYLQKGITLNKWFTMLPIHVLAANPEQVSIELLCITIGAEKTASEGKKKKKCCFLDINIKKE